MAMETKPNDPAPPLDFEVPNWMPPGRPFREPMEGRFCRLEPLDPVHHGLNLFASYALDRAGKNWTYLPYGPFSTVNDFQAWAEQSSRGTDPLFFAVVDRNRKVAVGVASYLRIDPTHGCIEVGHINYSPLLQRTPAATEAMYLMMKHVFALGYRRYEWKCHALNAPSRAAALRLGFSFEGIFRQAAVVKGRNRDTAWYAMIDKEWPVLQNAHAQWLAPSNFDEQGRQRVSLSVLTAPILKQRG